MKINLFGDVFIGSNKHEFFIYEIKKVKSKEGDLVDFKTVHGHYSTLKSLFQSLIDVHLKSFVEVESFDELKKEIIFINKLIEENYIK